MLFLKNQAKVEIFFRRESALCEATKKEIVYKKVPGT